MERLTYQHVTDAQALPRIAQEISEAPWIGLDLETTHLDPRMGRIRICSVNTGRGVYVIDAFQTGTLAPILAALNNPTHASGKGRPLVIGQNLNFDQKWLAHHHGCWLWPIFDTWKVSSILYNGKIGRNDGHDLYSIYKREMPELQGTLKELDLGASDWSAPRLSQEQLDYAAEDVTYMGALYKILRAKLEDRELLKVALLEFKAGRAEVAMELNGIPFDTAAWVSLADAAEQKAETLRRELMGELPHPYGQRSLFDGDAFFNIDSGPQILASLQRLGVKIGKDPIADTQEETLAMVAADWPLARKLIAYRGASKAASTYGRDFLKWVHPQTGCIHTHYYPFTEAGRYASSSPNLQNIPRDSAYRRCFACPAGWTFVLADYSQIELRLMAEASQDPLLLDVFRRNGDPHKTTAALMLGISEDRVTKDQRQMAKPVNFGFIYGLGAKRLIVYAQMEYTVSLTLKEATSFRSAFFQGYKGISKFHDDRLRLDKPRRLSWTMGGRLRYMGDRAHNEYFNCLDAETEALTQRGWIRGFDLTTADILLTKNPETGCLEWQQATEVKKYPVARTQFVRFRSKSFDALSTHNHRWLVYNKRTEKNECRTSAEISVYGDHRIHLTGNYPGASSSVYADSFVEVCGWFLTDGSYGLRGRKKNTPRVTLTQSARANPGKVARIDAAVAALGWKVWRGLAADTQVVSWTVMPAESAILHALFPARVLTLDFLLRLTQPQLALLLEVMLLGDGTGCLHEGESAKFTCGTAAKADMFQTLSVLAGKASTLRVRDLTTHKARSSKLPAGQAYVQATQPHYIVSVRRRDKAQITAAQRSVFEGEMPVWCPMVPNTYFVARRNGCVFITGNTPIQGTGADGLKNSLALAYDRIRARYSPDEVLMTHMVHDEIILRCRDDAGLVAEVKKMLQGAMEDGMRPYLKSVPVEALPDAGRTWADAKH